MKRLRLLFPTFIALFAGLVSSNASASGVSFEILVESEAIGDASTVILIIKNEELLFPIDQIVVLEPGDTISVQIETNALGMPGVGVSALGSVLLLGDLTDSSHGAQGYRRISRQGGCPRRRRNLGRRLLFRLRGHQRLRFGRTAVRRRRNHF